MLAIGEENVASKFVIKFEGSKSCESIKSKDWSYIYVDDGFFKVIKLPMLPFMILGHLVHFYGLYLLLVSRSILPATFITSSLFMLWAGFGVTAGSHRLWCHRSYEARFIFRAFLMIGHTMSGQYSIARWSHGHRTHHRHSDTDADPHNVKRGFTFSHLGWMLRKEHPAVDIKGEQVSISDILNDPIAKFQHDHYLVCFLLFSVILPIITPVICFGESFLNSVIVCFFMRLVTQTHDTAFVNSASHMFGDRPYNDKINSTENSWVSFGAIGEGYHNFHHAFPYDYAAGEVGNFFNPTKLLIDTMRLLGQVTAVKQASPNLINQSKQKVIHHLHDNNNVHPY